MDFMRQIYESSGNSLYYCKACEVITFLNVRMFSREYMGIDDFLTEGKLDMNKVPCGCKSSTDELQESGTYPMGGIVAIIATTNAIRELYNAGRAIELRKGGCQNNPFIRVYERKSEVPAPKMSDRVYSLPVINS